MNLVSAIRTADKMAECRNVLRGIHGDRYDAFMRDFRLIVAGVARDHCEGNQVAAVLRLVNEAKDDGHPLEAEGVMILMAAAVDEMERPQ